MRLLWLGWHTKESGSSYAHGDVPKPGDIVVQSLRGRVRYGCGPSSAVLDLLPGQLLILPRGAPGHHWCVVGDEPWEVRWIHVMLAASERTLLQYPPHPSGLIHLPAAPSLNRILDGQFGRLLELRGRSEFQVAILRDHLAAMIVGEITLFHGPPHQVRDPHVAAALDFLDRHLADHDLALADLVAAAGCGRSVLVQRFRAEMGMPPMRYLEGRRLEIAAERLRRDDDPIAMVADAVGWADPRHFATRFRRRFGCSPSLYRAQQDRT